MPSSPRRIGLWLVGAFGGVGSTTALGLAALRQKLTDTTGMVTALPQFAGVDFDPAEAFIIGGHDIRQTSFTRAAAELHARSNVFSESLLLACKPQLDEWSANVKPGVVFQPNAVIAALADRPDVRRAETAKQALAAIQADLAEFRTTHNLDELVVVNVASTEPPFAVGDDHSTWAKLSAALDRGGSVLPTSALYAVAALDAGCPFVNLTPSLGATFPAANELAKLRKVPHLGQDAKTGETLLKSVLAPMFLKRNLKVLSWVGHNILGNRDGLVLNDPANKSSKVKSKEALLGEMLGYQPQSHVSIEYIESLDDWKTAWDHIHFEGFLGVKMTLQFTWQGCDSLLAAPLVIDLARLAALAHRKGSCGTFTPAACFFKSPLGVAEHDLGTQFGLLEGYLS
jgi:myo-inositol-1-phosphate synthase